MGVGTPINILENIALGIDMFDCVMPTRNARNGMLFTAHGTINIKNKKWEDDFSPLDEMGITTVDTLYSKAYVKHLFAANEYLGKQIASIHNLGFYLWLVREARKHILAGDFASWKQMMVRQMDKRLQAITILTGVLNNLRSGFEDSRQVHTKKILYFFYFHLVDFDSDCNGNRYIGKSRKIYKE